MDRPFFGRIESLRGIFCLFVAAYHGAAASVNNVPLLQAAQSSDAGWLNRGLAQVEVLLLPGHAALMVFFVISGCVLRVSLQYGPQDVFAAARRFFIARIFRIYPIVLASSIVAIFFYDWIVPAIVVGEQSRPLSFGAWLANVGLLDVHLNRFLWALQVEVLMAPFILLFYFVEKSLGPKVILAIAVITTVLSFGNWILWRPFSHNFFAFVLGLVVPTIGRQFVQGMSNRTAGICVILLIPVLLLPGQTIGFFSQFSAVIEAYAAFLLVSLAAFRGDLRNLGWLDGRAVRRLGLISGSYYVLHIFCIQGTAAYSDYVIPAKLCVELPAVALVIYVAIFLVSVSLVAAAGYLFVEAPGIALGKRLVALLSAKPAFSAESPRSA